ncbi:MAG: histidinol-phosphate transaminase [Acidimicrobiia bacterium]
MIGPRDDLRLHAGYHSAQVEVPVRLNTNEAPVPPPPELVERLALLPDRIEWHRYPDRRYRALRGAVADLHGVRPDQVFVANGSNEVLQTLCLAYGGAGRSMATFEPTYALHGHIGRVTGTTVVSGERAADLSLDLAEVHRVLEAERPHLTCLCSPNNPTGLVDRREAVVEVLGAVPGLLVVDEAYGQFAPWSALELAGDDVPLVVTRTFSKTWSMAGLRLGYLVGPAPLVAQLDEVVLPYHLDAFQQAAGLLSLEHGDAMDRRVAALVEERGRLAARLSDLAVDVWPSDANFVLFRPRGRSGHDVWQALVDRGVLVRDCSSWPRLADCLRVTVGTQHEDDAFLAALEEVLA